MTPAIRIRGLTKEFFVRWTGERILALNDLSLTVEKGEVFGLLGPNGSGKTTTLNLLLGLLLPTSGEMVILDNDIDNPAVRERIGFLPESPYFYGYLNGEEILRFYGRLCGLEKKALKERLAYLLDLVGLYEHRHRHLVHYSKGMLQRIGFAQSLINNPEVLFLDEPIGGLDPIGTREMQQLILEMKKEGKTIFLCSHLLSHVQEVCDRIGILNRGVLIEEGPVDTIGSLEDRIQIVARGLSSGALDEVLDIIKRDGAELISAEHPKESLEDRFNRTIRRDT